MKIQSNWKHVLCALLAAGISTSSFAKEKKHDGDRDRHSSKSRSHHVEKKDHKRSGPSSGVRFASQSRPDMNRRPSPSSPRKSEPKREAPRIVKKSDGPRHDYRDRDRDDHRHFDRHDYHYRPGVVLGSRPSVLFGWRPTIPAPVATPMYPSYGVSVATVQRALAERGFYYGYVDGYFGPMTSRAIASFQARAGLAVTGEINSSLIRALGL